MHCLLFWNHLAFVRKPNLRKPWKHLFSSVNQQHYFEGAGQPKSKISSTVLFVLSCPLCGNENIRRFIRTRPSEGKPLYSGGKNKWEMWIMLQCLCISMEGVELMNLDTCAWIGVGVWVFFLAKHNMFRTSMNFEIYIWQNIISFCCWCGDSYILVKKICMKWNCNCFDKHGTCIV